jgi:phosphoribosylanthranilate isomerase
LEAIRIVKPAWVDLASGVEEGGRKSARKVEELLRKVKDD